MLRPDSQLDPLWNRSPALKPVDPIPSSYVHLTRFQTGQRNGRLWNGLASFIIVRKTAPVRERSSFREELQLMRRTWWIYHGDKHPQRITQWAEAPMMKDTPSCTVLQYLNPILAGHVFTSTIIYNYQLAYLGELARWTSFDTSPTQMSEWTDMHAFSYTLCTQFQTRRSAQLYARLAQFQTRLAQFYTYKVQVCYDPIPTWPVLKPVPGFKTGQPVLKQVGPLPTSTSTQLASKWAVKTFTGSEWYRYTIGKTKKHSD